MVEMFAWVNLLLLVLSVQVNSLVVGKFGSIKLVSVSSIYPSKQTCGSNVHPNKTFRAINVHASKPVYDNNVC